MKTKNLLDVKNPYPKSTCSWNAKFIPSRLEELAKAGIYYESRIIHHNMIHPTEIEQPVIGGETPIHKEFREMMRDIGICV